jgi:hypothetical protein
MDHQDWVAGEFIYLQYTSLTHGISSVIALMNEMSANDVLDQGRSSSWLVHDSPWFFPICPEINNVLYRGCAISLDPLLGSHDGADQQPIEERRVEGMVNL